MIRSHLPPFLVELQYSILILKIPQHNGEVSLYAAHFVLETADWCVWSKDPGWSQASAAEGETVQEEIDQSKCQALSLNPQAQGHHQHQTALK
jgi:hypothetical protein